MNKDTALIPRIDLRGNFLAKKKGEIGLTLNDQATRFPVFKDVSGLWRYDYKAAERKRI